MEARQSAISANVFAQSEGKYLHALPLMLLRPKMETYPLRVAISANLVNHLPKCSFQQLRLV